MWTVKKFKTYEKMMRWVEKNMQKYDINQLFLLNAWAVEYRRISGKTYLNLF